MGEGLALLSGLFFATANITIARGTASGANDNGAFLSILVTAALAWLAMLAFPSAGHVERTVSGLAWFVAAGLLTIFIGRVFLFASVQHLGAVRASAVKRLNPVFSVLLGVVLLGEPVSAGMSLGMTLIFASFGLLARQAWVGRSGAERSAKGVAALANLGYFYGPVSAFAYATGYLARKQGLVAMPDPSLGTFIGAVAGAVAFVAAAGFLASYRDAVQSTFRSFNPWLMTAAVMSSFGQLLGFLALSYSTVSRVVLITSMEVIFTMVLSAWLLRRYERLDALTVLAALMSIAGAALIILR